MGKIMVEAQDVAQKIAPRGLIRALIITPTRELALQVLILVITAIIHFLVLVFFFCLHVLSEVVSTNQKNGGAKVQSIMTLFFPGIVLEELLLLSFYAIRAV